MAGSIMKEFGQKKRQRIQEYSGEMTESIGVVWRSGKVIKRVKRTYVSKEKICKIVKKRYRTSKIN